MHEESIYEEIYQNILFDYSRDKTNFHRPKEYTTYAIGKNPACGDLVEIYAIINNNIIEHCFFYGRSCAICTSSAVLITHIASNKKIHDIYNIAENMYQSCLGSAKLKYDIQNDYNAEIINLLFNIHKTMPIRIKCATLPIHALMKALSDLDN